MKNIILSLAIALAGLCASAAYVVQPLCVGTNRLIGGPGKITQIEAVATETTGTITVKRVLDTWSYAMSATNVTTAYTNAVSWASVTETNRVVSLVDDYVIVTNAVYTNVVGGVTNRLYDTTRRANGSHPVTNSVVTVRPTWTVSKSAWRTASVTNDVVSHAVYTNTIGTITLSNHEGSLTPTNLHFTAGDVLVIDYDGIAAIRLYSLED